MKRPIRIIAGVAAVAVLVAALCIAAKKQSSKKLDYRIFGSLDEFSCFDAYETEELPDPEEPTKGLAINDRRCFSVSFEGYDFNVYAYVFASDADAASFAERCGGLSEGALYSVSRDDRAMLVTGGEKRSRQFLKYLFEHLTVPAAYPAEAN